MIIKPRMPRVLGRRRYIGRLGMRSLQRSMIHVRRMLVSRLPESLSEDLQQAAEQPLGWGEMPALQEPSQIDGTIMEAPRRQPRPAQPPVQRAPEAGTPSRESSSSMPRDLQALFDLHKGLGRVQTNPELKTQAEVFNQTGGAVLPEEEQPTEPVQRSPETKEPPKRRRVRSKVEYVNRPDPDMVRRSQEAEATPPAEPDEEYDFVDTFPPDDFADEITEPDPPTAQAVQRATDRAEAPPPREVDTSPDEAYADDPPDTQQSMQRAVDEPPVRRDADTPSEPDAAPHVDDPAATQLSIQRAVDQAEASVHGETDTASVSHRAPDVDAAGETQQSVQRAVEPTSQHDVDSSMVERPIQRNADDAIQRAIEAAEAPPASVDDTQPTAAQDTTPSTPVQRDTDDDDAYTQTFVEPTRRRMTMSDPQAPTSIQRTSLPQDLSVESDDTEASERFDSEDDAAPESASSASEGVVQPTRDDIQRFEEKGIDLGEALFGSDEPTDSAQVPEHDGPTPTLMPPIGKLRHTRPVSERSMPRQVARRTDREADQEVSPMDLMRMASASVDAEMAKEEAIQQAEQSPQVQMSRDDESIVPEDDETQLLTLLDLPPDTPIQREGAPMPTPSESTVQREPADSDVAGPAADAPPDEGDEGQNLEETAKQVYDILKRKHFRIDNERYKGKK
jgi:hypothetical protein